MHDTFWSLFAGYTAIWILIAVYIQSLRRRINRLEKKSAEAENLATDKDT
jgi:CcmD family protein